MPTNGRYHSDQEWFQLITTCRQSGLSDREWCAQQGIPASTFYNAVTRLRKKACSIPGRENAAPVMDLTSRKQDVVQIDIIPDDVPELASPVPVKAGPPDMHFDNLHTIEIQLQSGATIRVNNGADAVLLEKVITILGRPSYVS